ncbi:hypothetical protein BT96DRAFT_639988 [Gymnopus androsaceus JB14]|uniref:Uncharacterized protein n=1 Tax=Gymnopus androsaceus JB14 TaxID=1447944 RepID=A0A6A4HRX5_9AGAR|nr:hypothetical protein BT96DRAFT_639988 [Gymnopus androsaceus JB14]
MRPLPEREAAAESIGIDSVAATLDVVTAQTATPAQRNAVADPSSPLTPLPETSPCKKPAETTEDPSTGLGQDLFGSYVPNDINKLPESGATINPSRLRSRLPRPTNATASSSKPNQASHASKADIGKSALTVQKPKPQRNAFDVLMPKSGSKGKTAEKGKSVAR